VDLPRSGPLAIRNRAFHGLRRSILPVVEVTLLDMALPTFLTAWGEERISSSAAGILTATDPLFTAVLALWLIRSEAVDRKRFAGLVMGFAGVIALLGIDFRAALRSFSVPGRCSSVRWASPARHCCTGAGSPMPALWGSPRS
jgi:drug/metabolite transporter (DMT)-like permease